MLLCTILGFTICPLCGLNTKFIQFSSRYVWWRFEFYSLLRWNTKSCGWWFFFLNFVIHEMEFEILLCSLLYHIVHQMNQLDTSRREFPGKLIKIVKFTLQSEFQLHIYKMKLKLNFISTETYTYVVYCFKYFVIKFSAIEITFSISQFHIYYMRKQKHGISSHMQPIKFRWKLNFLRIKFSKFFLQFSPNFHATRGGILRSFETSKENIFQHTTLRTHSLNFLMLFFTSKQLLRISNSQN